MKLRLSLVVAGVALCSAFAGAAWAFPPTTSVTTTDPVDVIEPTFLVDVNLQGHDNEIPADGAYHRVDDITTIAHDINYSYTLTDLEVLSNGFQVPSPPPLNCGVWDYRLSTGSDIETSVGFVFPGDSANHDSLRDLELKIESAGTNASCQVFGGIVQATFEVGN